MSCEINIGQKKETIATSVLVRQFCKLESEHTVREIRIVSNSFSFGSLFPNMILKLDVAN